MDFSINSGGKLAHIGGALFGYFYTINLMHGKDMGKDLTAYWIFLQHFSNPGKSSKSLIKRLLRSMSITRSKRSIRLR